MLTKLLADEIKLKQAKNAAKVKTFSQLLTEPLQNYHNRLIDATAVVSAMLQIRQELEADDSERQNSTSKPTNWPFTT